MVARLVEDTAWHPVGKAELQNWSPTQRAIFKIFLGSPLKLWASVGHWWLWHFNLDLYTPKQRPRVRFHLPCCMQLLPSTRTFAAHPAAPVTDASASLSMCMRMVHWRNIDIRST